ncbi:SDR family oxidoreductase [Variovorax sp. PBL-E5]|uniref:SDR family oxidoreductase n=1 Tax=Variovorax sp. PBL-E5 TaxID=434014 RepID=UPI0013197E27|nr:SDR family oxidoreductase [Variovorax sp. PBL-E5]VTU46035.1 D-beta-hydroxybutyrate dehydrogenase [Variovorax sp. PBL-E5]
MNFQCSGRRVVVTAGASGIGAEIASALIEAGAAVHVCDIDRGRLDAFAAAHPSVGVSLCDVADEAAVVRMVDEAAERLGRVDALVNNAGISGPTSPIELTPTDDWMRTYAINVHGSFFCTRAAVPHLRRAGGGSLVNIASVAGRLGFPLRSAYVGSKWALIGLTKTWAMELGPSDIGVNAILPGLVEGPRIRSVIAARSQATGRSEADIEAGFLADISLRRMVKSSEVAALAVYLLSPAGRNISGQTISVDGNFEVIR